jgi:LmbE family N-acetylglucosaminyl deacetylase
MNDPIPTNHLLDEPTGTILGVWAHPDDEAYLSAGLMAAAVRAGSRVVVVTATYGELGTADPQHWPPHRLTPVRRREMAASLAALGVREHHWLGYPDGGCPDIDATRAVADLARIIDDVRPDTIVTFGPDGMTGHPDHRAVSAWTTAAWQAARPGSWLWYATLLPSFHERWGPTNDAIGLFPPDADPPCTDVAEAAAVVHCGGSLLDAKIAALSAHRSQTAPLVEAVGADTYREWWSVEAFVDASRVLAGSRP